MHYLIAQHIPDPFRQEPKNVGVVVAGAGEVRARFVGEVAPGQYDGRKTRWFAFPDVYRQWIDYWRSLLSSTAPDDLARFSGPHFRLVDGGDLATADHPSPDDAANFLYALLVSEGGFVEALEGADGLDGAIENLRQSVA